MKIPLQKRFWSKVVKTETCWNWIAGKDSYGYGMIRDEQQVKRLCSRISWEWANGLIPPGMLVCHTCDNRACVNPAHLFIGDQKANMQDCSRKGRIRANNRGKLSDFQVRVIRRAFTLGVKGQFLAKTFNTGETQMYRIRNGESRNVKHKPALTS